ncbi:T9SS type A sorting domain-containing protein [Aquimarina agarilytica]|uniref:T9SS type A sorting domain-containing protein n=1 Tax=Aquimarina agarilytica TaxID=1087449 RepID=UPI0002881B18|nr:T9SS type A sorting domain-containing protein [Aquimarina agarilytica]
MKSQFLIISFLGIAQINAQNPIQAEVNLNTKHSVHGVSEFDRSKFMILHADIDDNEWDSDAQRKQFLEDYDVYLGRNNGGMVWEFDQSSEDPNKKGWPDVNTLKSKGESSKNSYAKQKSTHDFEGRYGNMIFGGQPTPMYPSGQLTRPSKCCSTSEPWAYKDYDAVAEYYANYLKEFFGSGKETGKPRPKYVEVLNEPFVKARKLGTTNANITQMHKVVAQRIKALNPDIKVGGYSAAHPAYEDNNFNHWRNNWELFINEAGNDMDFFSLHLYDFLADSGEELQRKGSNTEAILDMVEQYSYIKLGKVKPFSISEYGWLGRSLNGPYNKPRDWFNIRTFSSMMMQFMERQDQIISAIPFMILKAKWWQNPDNYKYSYRLLRQNKELEGQTGDQWVYTDFLKFFELWSTVKGTRVDTFANDPDMLIDAYVNKDRAYVILSNLEHHSTSVALNIPELKANTIEAMVNMKHLYADKNGVPVLENSELNSPKEITIGKEGTVILEYRLKNEIEFTNTSNEQKVYAETYLKPIEANKSNEFVIKNITLGSQGEAILRLGMGRAHGLMLSPQIKMNGEEIAMVNDWKGYDQKNRDQFFGVIEVPVPYKLIKKSNEINITFPDTGGMISSLSLQVFNFEKPIDRLIASTDPLNTPLFEPNKTTLTFYPNPSKNSISFEGITSNSLTVKLYDISGNLVFTKIVTKNQKEISLNTISSGLYMLKLNSGKDEKISKFIKI